MPFMNWIIERLRDISDFFYDIFLEVRGWIFPFYLAAPFFYEICWLFYYLANSFSDFGEWVDDAASKLKDILTWSSIRGLILGWLPDLQPVITWWQNWWSSVKTKLRDWWDEKKQDVRDWIDDATQGLDKLKADWSYFWTVTLPTLITFSWLTDWWNTKLRDVNDLIDSQFKVRFPFYNSIVEFFTDPLEWLLNRFFTWFLGEKEE